MKVCTTLHLKLRRSKLSASLVLFLRYRSHPFCMITSGTHTKSAHHHFRIQVEIRYVLTFWSHLSTPSIPLLYWRIRNGWLTLMRVLVFLQYRDTWLTGCEPSALDTTCTARLSYQPTIVTALDTSVCWLKKPLCCFSRVFTLCIGQLPSLLLLMTPVTWMLFCERWWRSRKDVKSGPVPEM